MKLKLEINQFKCKLKFLISNKLYPAKSTLFGTPFCTYNRANPNVDNVACSICKGSKSEIPKSIIVN